MQNLPHPARPVARRRVKADEDPQGAEVAMVWATIEGALPPARGINRLQDQLDAAVRALMPPPAPWVHLRIRTLDEE